MKTSLKNAELVNTVIRKMMTIMFIAGLTQDAYVGLLTTYRLLKG